MDALISAQLSAFGNETVWVGRRLSSESVDARICNKIKKSLKSFSLEKLDRLRRGTVGSVIENNAGHRLRGTMNGIGRKFPLLELSIGGFPVRSGYFVRGFRFGAWVGETPLAKDRPDTTKVEIYCFLHTMEPRTNYFNDSCVKLGTRIYIRIERIISSTEWRHMCKVGAPASLY